MSKTYFATGNEVLLSPSFFMECYCGLCGALLTVVNLQQINQGMLQLFRTSYFHLWCHIFLILNHTLLLHLRRHYRLLQSQLHMFCLEIMVNLNFSKAFFSAFPKIPFAFCLVIINVVKTMFAIWFPSDIFAHSGSSSFGSNAVILVNNNIINFRHLSFLSFGKIVCCRRWN